MNRSNRGSGLLSNSAFRRVWAAGAITGMVRWLDMLVLTLYAYELTGEPGSVALAFLIRMLPRLLFGMFVGALADRFDRRRIWLASLLILSVMYFGLTALVALTEIQYWQLLAFVFVAGTVWSVEFPTRRAMIADVVGPNRVGRAVGLDWSTDSVVRIPGPLIGAGFLQAFGAEWAYLFTACVFVAAAAIASTLRYRPPLRTGVEPQGFSEVARATLRDVAAGLVYLRGRGLLIGALALTLAFNLLYPAYNAALPEIGIQFLQVDQFRIGVIEAMVGVGSALSALVIAGWSTWSQSGRIYYIGTAWFVLCVTGVALSDIYALTVVIGLCMGFGFSAFAIMQTSILVTRTPPAMRGRMMGLLSFVIGIGPLTGLQVFLLFDWFGVRGGVLVVVAEALALIALAAVFWPMIVKRLPSSDPAVAAVAAPQRAGRAG